MGARYWMLAEDRLIDGPAGVRIVDGFVVLTRVKLPAHVLGLASRSLLHVYDRDASPNYEGQLVHLTMAVHTDGETGEVDRVSILSRQVEAGGEARIPAAWRCPPGVPPERLDWSAAQATSLEPFCEIRAEEPSGDGA